jgi:hypothetical protein
MKVSKCPSLQAVSFETLVSEYGATYIRDALARFIVSRNHPDWSSCEVKAAALNTFLPFRMLAIFHKIKFCSEDLGKSIVVNSIHARP